MRVDNVPLEVVLLEVFLELVLGSFIGAQTMDLLALLIQVMQQLLRDNCVARLQLVLLVHLTAEVLQVFHRGAVTHLHFVHSPLPLIGRILNNKPKFLVTSFDILLGLLQIFHIFL